MSRDPRPKPGSEQAIEAGCICSASDNHRGLRAPVPPSSWYVTGGCPIHDPDGEITDDASGGTDV
jgi:hypothetical protein